MSSKAQEPSLSFDKKMVYTEMEPSGEKNLGEDTYGEENKENGEENEENQVIPDETIEYDMLEENIKHQNQITTEHIDYKSNNTSMFNLVNSITASG